jgi:hypothetical protein
MPRESYHIDGAEQGRNNRHAAMRDILALHHVDPSKSHRRSCTAVGLRQRDVTSRRHGEFARVQHVFLEHLIGGIDFD